MNVKVTGFQEKNTYTRPESPASVHHVPSPHGPNGPSPAYGMGHAPRKSFITDPFSEILGPGGTVDPRQGGANMDPRQLLTDGTIAEGLLHLHSHMHLGYCWEGDSDRYHQE